MELEEHAACDCEIGSVSGIARVSLSVTTAGVVELTPSQKSLCLLLHLRSSFLSLLSRNTIDAWLEPKYSVWRLRLNVFR